MLNRRNVLLSSLGLALGVCAVSALRLEVDFLGRPRVRRVKETAFVSEGNRRLAGFCDGLAADPHWDARRALCPAPAGRILGVGAWCDARFQLARGRRFRQAR